MADYMTFAEIQAEVKEAVKTTKTSKATLIKNAINMVYLNEIIPVDSLYPLFWLRILDESIKAKAIATITGITQADPGVVTAAAHGFIAGDIISAYNVAGMTEVNQRTYKVGTVPNVNSFQLLTLEGANVDTSGFTAYTSGGTVHHRGVALTGIKRILSFAWKDMSIPVAKGKSEWFDTSTSYWDESTSRPDYYLHKQYYGTDGTQTDQLIWFYAANEAYNGRIWYEKKVARLSANGDIPQLPWEFHETIVSGAVSRLIKSGTQNPQGGIWPSIYTAQLQALKDYNRELYRTNLPEEKPFML